MERDESRQLSLLRPVTHYSFNRPQPSVLSPSELPQYQQEQGGLQDYVRIFFKYRQLIFIATSAALILGLLYCVVATPMFTAESSLKIGTYQPLIPGAEIERSLLAQSSEQDYFNTQTAVLTSLTLADKVLSEGDIDGEIKRYLQRKTSVFSTLRSSLRSLLPTTKSVARKPVDNGVYNHSLPVLRRYLRLVTISPVRKTSLVKVSVTAADPVIAQKIANAHSTAFIDLVRSQRQQSTSEQLIFLKRQAEELAERVANSERSLASYAEDNSIVALNENENITVKRMAELNQLLTEATAKRIRSESFFVEAQSGSGIAASANEDQTIREARIALDQAKSEYAMMSERFQPSYPRMMQLKARIDSLQGDLRRQRRQTVAALEAEYRANLKAEEELKNQLEIQKSKVFELSRREAQYNILKREYESLKDLHQTVLRQMKQTQISSESVASNISAVDQAPLPTDPSSPRRLLTMVLALFIGPSVGFGLGILKEITDNTVETPEDVQRSLSLPSLGVIPAFSIADSHQKTNQPVYELTDAVATDEQKEREEAQEHSPGEAIAEHRDLITVESPAAVASEAYRTIRTALMLSSADKPPRVILVTSAKKGEGKTTLATNLAVTFAQAWKKTVIVCADLRRPVLRNFFPADPTWPGLVEYLTGQRELDDILYETPISNLYLIAGGTIPPNPAELLASKKMANMIATLSRAFDYVVIDASPVLPVADPLILSQMADGVVLVVRAHETEKHLAREARNRLEQVGAKMLGVVLNDVDVKDGSYYYYYRDAYAGYYAEEKHDHANRA